MNNNFRHRLVGLSFLVGIAVPGAAIAQAPIINVGSGSTSDRLVQLETSVNSQGQLLYQIQKQLNDSQRDIDTLRGQIQENQYQLNQIVERQKDLYIQLDKLGEGKPSSPSVTPGKTESTDPTAATKPKGSENEEYSSAATLALNSKTNSQIEEAITALQGFIKAHPQSTYLANANYWLGQLNYNKGSKEDATYYFATVAKNYPKSPKSSDALYKVGIILQEQGKVDSAKQFYNQVVDRYPQSAAAKQAGKRLASL